MKKKERESSFELMRILSMFFVVLYHFLISTGGSILNNSSGNVLVFWEWISMIIIVHVNSFILSTGYFQYKQKFSWKKFFSLLIMGYMYKVIISIILQLVYHTPLSSVEILRTFSPFYFNNYWFLSVYLLLYLLSPYINILINKLSQKEHRNFIILLFIIFTIIPTITNQKTFSNTGFGIIVNIINNNIMKFLCSF